MMRLVYAGLMVLTMGSFAAAEPMAGVECRYTVRFGDRSKAPVNGSGIIRMPRGSGETLWGGSGNLLVQGDVSMKLAVSVVERPVNGSARRFVNWSAELVKHPSSPEASPQVLGRYENTNREEGAHFTIHSIERGPDVSSVSALCELLDPRDVPSQAQ